MPSAHNFMFCKCGDTAETQLRPRPIFGTGDPQISVSVPSVHSNRWLFLKGPCLSLLGPPGFWRCSWILWAGSSEIGCNHCYCSTKCVSATPVPSQGDWYTQPTYQYSSAELEPRKGAGLWRGLSGFQKPRTWYLQADLEHNPCGKYMSKMKSLQEKIRSHFIPDGTHRKGWSAAGEWKSACPHCGAGVCLSLCAWVFKPQKSLGRFAGPHPDKGPCLCSIGVSLCCRRSKHWTVSFTSALHGDTST